MKRFSVGLFLKVVVMIVGCGALIGFVTMGLWNWLVPELFHGPVINFWQALGLLILSKLLLGSFAKGGGAPWGEKRRQQWKEKMKEKMKHMSDDERAKWKENFSRCVGGRWNDLEEEEKKDSTPHSTENNNH
ncbi:hypothetical protein MKQ70_34020 [Chitinophaga sedimenti]|uniref:hypothetical protein n=1 Tax=Chitinophaga sedimenti TaxID=2033606 RepID=UPI002003D6DD|nr:hypothetical protein [Chitinophaga sedimenti]MCK7559695.1 hypothetical protein [Chitinophaga sedimenti]